MKTRFQILLTLASGWIVTDSLLSYFRPGLAAKHPGAEALLSTIAAMFFLLALLNMLGIIRTRKPKS